MSIGHSTHEITRFLALLHENVVKVVADVRSSPYSRYNPQFNRENLRRALLANGIRYEFFGEELGGRPDGDEFYDREGHVLYGRVAKTSGFNDGLSRLIKMAEHCRVAIMCSEEDPAMCHRFLLVTRVAPSGRDGITHIRRDGSIQRTEDVVTFGDWSDPVCEEPSLLDSSVRSRWRSPKPVPRPIRTLAPRSGR